MVFNELSLEEQIEILTENAGVLPKTALLSFASRLNEMSEAGESLFVAVLNDEQQEIATFDIGKAAWIVFTDAGKFDNLPDEVKSQLSLKSIAIQDILDQFIKNSVADGIAFNPFSSDKGIFFADRNILALAW